MFVGGSLGDAVAPLVGTGLLLLGWVLALTVRRLRHTGTRPVPDDAVLRTVALSKAYGARSVLTDVDLELRPGAVLALLGPNGAGKTTLLGSIVGLVQPSGGAVHLLGHRVVPGAAVLARVGVAIEEPGFAPHLTGRQNLDTLWAVSGRPRDDAHVDLVADLSGLRPFLDQRADEYSQGMKQRLALAGAMLGLPELLLLDEPTNGLDPEQTRELGRVLRRYAASGRTVVLASHHLAEVDDLCTDVAVLRGGRLVWHGPIESAHRTANSIVVGVDDPAGAMDRLVADPAWQRLEPAPALRAGDHRLHVSLDGAPLEPTLAALAGSGIPVRSVQTVNGLSDFYRHLVTEATDA